MGKGSKLSVKTERGKEGSSFAHGELWVMLSVSHQLKLLILWWWHLLLVVPGGSDSHPYSSSGKLPSTRCSVPGLSCPFQVTGVIRGSLKSATRGMGSGR